MEPYENFKPRCSIADAEKITGQATPEIGKIARECYIDTYQKESSKWKNDHIWNQHCALASVYMLGFISGARAVRERKK